MDFNEGLSKIHDFFKKNEENINNPIVKSFISDDENRKLLEKAIVNPTTDNKNRVDVAFSEHYTRVKKIKYVSSLIHFFSIDYDKKKRTQRRRNLLILDKGLSNENEVTRKELIEDDTQHTNTSFNSLEEQVENEHLENALKKLTRKQVEILEMMYLKNLTCKEISEIIQTTPQNVSNQHRKALRRLNYLIKSTR